MGSDLRLLLTTCASREVANQLAVSLVEQRHAACVNVLPGVSSIYRWMGKIESENEVLLLIKTATTELAAIESTIKIHSGYELPELIAIEISDGASDYLAWVAASVGKEVN